MKRPRGFCLHQGEAELAAKLMQCGKMPVGGVAEQRQRLLSQHG